MVRQIRLWVWPVGFRLEPVVPGPGFSLPREAWNDPLERVEDPLEMCRGQVLDDKTTLRVGQRRTRRSERARADDPSLDLASAGYRGGTAPARDSHG